MVDEADNRNLALTELTADIVSAFIGNNSVPAATLPELIASVHAALSRLAHSSAPSVEPQVPAVLPRKSITQDFLICLDDGKKFKALKRHLSQLGMTPDEYRAKWGLPRDYPMVAPNYSKARSALAKAAGLGTKAAPAEKAPAKRKAK